MRQRYVMFRLPIDVHEGIKALAEAHTRPMVDELRVILQRELAANLSEPRPDVTIAEALEIGARTHGAPCIHMKGE